MRASFPASKEIGMKKTMVIAAVAAFSGCVSAQPGAERVVLTANAANVSGCKFLGQASVTAYQMLDPATNQKDVQTNLRNEVIKMGGTHALTSGPTAQNPSTLIQTGDVYRC
jgi:hypothetical protein